MRVMGEHGVRMICLEPGDVLVFDGDVVHAGAAYRAPNTRVHVYLDVPSVKREYTIVRIHTSKEALNVFM